MLIELDGETLHLEGSIEDQYDQWQRLLEKIFESETGFSPAIRPAEVTTATTPKR